MIQHFVYSGGSAVIRRGDARAVRLAPNLAREPVAFDAELRHPPRFREAISALHDVVITDLRFVKKDKTAYLEWKKQQAAREQLVRREAHRQAMAEIEARRNAPVARELEREYDAARKTYWAARVKYADYLRKHDPALWRQLMPCDPVITVADDAVFFECFSKDQSAYGHLSVGRDAGFGAAPNLKLGTTNVDYSLALYEQFQTLRTYRPTRFDLDPDAFTVEVASQATHREEKIDLPQSWLKGFMKLQAAMTMPAVRVPLSREVVYSLLAFLKRHRARKSPRALRFELSPGRPARLVLEPWEQFFESAGPIYEGPATPPIRIWGTRRLLVLARLLPLMDSAEVRLLASGLPSFWVLRMGEMTFTLGLSGWTANDWSAGSSLDLLAPPRAVSAALVEKTVRALKQRRAATLSDLQYDCAEQDDYAVAAALRHLAQTGQVIHDLSVDRYRYRQIMSQPLGESQLGAEDPELSAARMLIEKRMVQLKDRQDGPNLTRVLIGVVESKPVEVMIDADERIRRGKCLCGHFREYGLRNGPCRHMIALRAGTSVHGLIAMKG